ncbi:hypothetical protein ACU3L3_06830 [Priestia endophytica]
MGTPYVKVQSVFHSKPQEKKALPEGLEEQFFINAVGDFETDLYPLHILEDNGLQEDLTNSEIQVIGLLMYKHYLERELDRILKLNNIIGRDIKTTGLGDSKSNTNKRLESLQEEIDKKISKLKPLTFD